MKSARGAMGSDVAGGKGEEGDVESRSAKKGLGRWARAFRTRQEPGVCEYSHVNNNGDYPNTEVANTEAPAATTMCATTSSDLATPSEQKPCTRLTSLLPLGWEHS